MASYTLQGFTNDASSPDLDATNINEMDNAIKIGHDFADGASATPEAGKAMVWPSESSPGTPYTIPTFLVKDMYRSQVESGSGGLLTVLYDNVDNPSIMRVIPKFRV